MKLRSKVNIRSISKNIIPDTILNVREVYKLSTNQTVMRLVEENNNHVETKHFVVDIVMLPFFEEIIN